MNLTKKDAINAGACPICMTIPAALQHVTSCFETERKRKEYSEETLAKIQAANAKIQDIISENKEET